MVDNVSLYASVRHNFREKLGISATNIWENKPAGAKDWKCRQSCFTRRTLSFRIADIRKVGLKFKLLLKKSILKHEKKKKPAGRPGLYIMNSMVDAISLLVNQFEKKNKTDIVKNKKLSRLSRSKTRVEGRGERGKRAVSTNVCNFIQIYSRYKVRY